MVTDASLVASDRWIKFAETRSTTLRDQLITEYAPLVRFVVGRLGIPPTSLLEAEDLVSYGMIGLINAIDRYDPSRGIRFEAFATMRIRGAVIDQLRTLNWLPRSAVSRTRQIECALTSLEQSLRRPAKEEEVAREIGVTIEHYRKMLVDMNVCVLSLDVPVNAVTQNEEGSALRDLVEDQNIAHPDEEIERQELVGALSTAIDNLPEREKLLLALYYQEELTMKEISKVLNVSESRVCQLHMQAVLRLRAQLHAFQSSGICENADEHMDAKKASRTASASSVEKTGRRKTNPGDVPSVYQTDDMHEVDNIKVPVGGGARSRWKVS